MNLRPPAYEAGEMTELLYSDLWGVSLSEYPPRPIVDAE